MGCQVWRWYHEVVGGGHCSIVDTWWQTETGGHMITPLPGAGGQVRVTLLSTCEYQLRIPHSRWAALGSEREPTAPTGAHVQDGKPIAAALLCLCE